VVILKTLTTLLNKLSKTSKNLFAKRKLDPLNPDHVDTRSPYGKHLAATDENVEVVLQGTLTTDKFTKGTIVTLTLADKTVFSKFISNK
jgi:hypothetical protein